MQELGLLEGEKVVLFVGALDRAHYFKGLDYLLQSLATLKMKPKLLVVGGGDLKHHFIKKAKEIGVHEQTTFLCRIDNVKLRKVYNVADVVVWPSTNAAEAFGIVLVNAYACRKPVIASDLPGVRTVVDHNRTGFLVQSGNIYDLAVRLEQILTDDPLAVCLGKNGYDKYVRYYTWERIGSQLADLYEQ